MAILIAHAAWSAFSEYPSARPVAVVVFALGTLYGLALGRVVHRAERPIVGAIALAAMATILVALPTSIAMQRIPHAAFGVTIYGLLPLPFVDLSIRANGFVTLRDKRHTITRDEIRALLDDGAELVIVATGWEGRAHVEGPIAGSVVVLRTEEAIEAYHCARANGRRVALLLHSTC